MEKYIKQLIEDIRNAHRQLTKEERAKAETFEQHIEEVERYIAGEEDLIQHSSGSYRVLCYQDSRGSVSDGNFTIADRYQRSSIFFDSLGQNYGNYLTSTEYGTACYVGWYGNSFIKRFDN